MRWIATIFATVLAGTVQAQQLLHQPTNSSPPVPMPAEVLDRIDDPFFHIVVQASPQPKTLSALINTLLEGGRSEFQSFVVGEQIGRAETATECGPSARRLVISFIGSHAPSGTVLDGNIFLSVFLTPGGPGRSIEVMSWDPVNGTYNYYKLEGTNWRFRNHSTDINSASEVQLADSCLACHVNGGPVMKEFTFPWNHWHGLSNTFLATYLASGTQSWPVANADFLGRRLTGAQVLEATVQSSIKRFINALNAQQTNTDDDGEITITNLRALLDSLFQPTELNLGSSNVKSGLDGGGLTVRSVGRMNIPDSFFVNIFQMRDIDLPLFEGQGLVTEVFTPGDLGFTVDEYEALLTGSGVDTACMPGRDTLFAWFGPEPSEFDRRMVERLQKSGVVDKGFVAAVLAVDVEEPLFSDARASLLRHVPKSISAPSRALLADVLRAAVIASLEATATRSAVEEDFLMLLRSANPVTELNTRVQNYISRTQTLLADPTTRDAHLRDLFNRLLRNRQTFRSNAVSRPLNEFLGLLPSN